MASKKPVKSVLSAVPSLPASNSAGAPEVMRVDELTLARVLRFMDKSRAAKADLQLASQELNGIFQEWIKTDPKAAPISKRINALQAEIREAEKSYAELLGKISSEFKIDMRKFAFDDETGVLQPLPDKPA